MSTKNSYHGINRKLVSAARKMAAWAVKRNIIPHSDQPDLEQELVIMLLNKMSNYDRKKCSKKTFAYHLCLDYLNDVHRDRNRPSRRFQFNLQSLNNEVEIDGEVVELISLIDEDSELKNHYCSETRQVKNADLKIDIEAFLEHLSPDCRKVCECLKTMNITETAKFLNVTRRTVQRKLRRMKNIFSNHFSDSLLSSKCRTFASD